MVLCLLVSLEGRLILMMTSRERILCVLEGGIPDTVPISPRIAYWLLEQKMTDLELKKVFDYDPIICVGCGLRNMVRHLSLHAEKLPRFTLL